VGPEADHLGAGDWWFTAAGRLNGKLHSRPAIKFNLYDRVAQIIRVKVCESFWLLPQRKMRNDLRPFEFGLSGRVQLRDERHR